MWYENTAFPITSIRWYLRQKASGTGRARALIPFKVPHGAIIHGLDVWYRKTAQSPGEDRNASCLIWAGPLGGFGAANPQSPYNSNTIYILNADGTTGSSVKSVAISPTLTVDNLMNSYAIYVEIYNDDVLANGADGLGIAGFRVNYTLQKVEVY